jgi:hypothetical protein
MQSYKRKVLVSAATAMALALAIPAHGTCAEEANSLTHGMVQMTLVVGATTQAEILETFGAPNITTVDGTGAEMWVYDRHATVTSNNESGFSIGMLAGGGGGGVGGGGGLGFGKSKSKGVQQSRSMTLIIKFDRQRRVSDFRSRSSSF